MECIAWPMRGPSCAKFPWSLRGPQKTPHLLPRGRAFLPSLLIGAALRSHVIADMLAAKGRKFLVEIGSQRRHRSSPPAHRTKTPKSRAELDPSVPGNCRFSGQVQVLSFENH